MKLLGGILHGNIKRRVEGKKYCIVHDGWDDGDGTHYLGQFLAIEGGGGEEELILISMAPLANEASFDEVSHVASFRVQLTSYGLDINDCICMVGDNCNTNKAVATGLGLKFVGCASHRFNLAVEKLFIVNAPLLEKLGNLMTKLRTLKVAGEMRQAQEAAGFVRLKKAKKRNATRWGSAKMMVDR